MNVNLDILKRRDSVPNTEGISQQQKLLARFVSAISGLISMILGFWVAFTLSAKCILAGLVLAISGALILTIEAPFFCMTIAPLAKIITFFDSKPYWVKTAFYGGLALPPIFICPGITTIGASIFIFISAALYGSMAIGKRGSSKQTLDAGGDSRMMVPEIKTNIGVPGAGPISSQPKPPGGFGLPPLTINLGSVLAK